MVGASILVAGAMAQARLFPVGAPYQSRAEFRKLSYKIQYHFTKAEVIEILGPPDQIRKDENDKTREVLLYGVDSATGVPTLGRFSVEVAPVPHTTFFASIRWDNRYEPTAPKMEEREIRSFICALSDEFIDEDPLRFIRVANKLIDLGEKKARYVLREYERSQESRFTNYRWLLPTLFPRKSDFKGKAKDFVKGEDIRFLSPDVPILVAPVFLTYVGAEPTVLHCRGVGMRRIRLIPEDDPFQLARSEDGRDRFLPQLKNLVRGAVQFAVNDTDRSFDSYYLQFLRCGAKWSDSLQTYVKGDGTVLPEPAFKRDRSGINP